MQAPATLPAARLVDGPWRGYLGWQIVPEHPSRFVLDTQNFVELWHREAGYLAGTGGSRFMPRFSTVRRTNGGRAYIPDRARCLRVTSTQAEVAYTFGEDDVAVKLVLVGGKCNVSARLGRAVVGHAYEFALLVAFKNGELVGFDEAEEKIEPTVLVHWQGCPRPVRTLRWRGLVWTLPEGTRVDYPLVPHNSYTQDVLPAADDYVGRISFPLTQDEQTLSIS